MSKLIIEMEMPKRCGACKCRQVEFDIDRVDVFCGIKDNEYVENPDSRPSWCPIKGVLPDEHGDLVDRDEMFGTINNRVALIDSCPEGKPSMKELFERDVLCGCLHDVISAKAVIVAERSINETHNLLL